MTINATERAGVPPVVRPLSDSGELGGAGRSELPSHLNNFNLIRLLAAAQVLVVHAGHHFEFEGPALDLLELFPGVPIFFFISGYLIYQSFARLGYARWKAFFANRFVRIYPGLVLCTALSVLAVALTGYFTGRDIGTFRMVAWLLAQVSVVQFYNPDFMRHFGTGVLNGSLWTISVEVQFYLAVPILFLLLRKQRTMWAALFAVSLACNVLIREAGDWNSMGWKLLTVSFLPWIYMFLIGFGLSSKRAWQARIMKLRFAVLLPLYVLSMVFIGDVTKNAANGINPVSFTVLTAILLKFAFADLGAFGRLFYKNDLSYGLYLYHMPVINLLLATGARSIAANVLITIAVTTLLAALSWWLVEKPALDLKKRFGRRTVAAPVG